MLSLCNSLTIAPNIPSSINILWRTFAGCTNLTGNIYIESNQITNSVNCFYNTSLTKNVYIPFYYENGIQSATYNAFTAAGYDNAGTQHGVYLKDIGFPINPEEWQYTQTGNTILLRNYIAMNEIVKVLKD